MRDYYLPPTDHPRALEMEKLQTELDEKTQRMNELDALGRDLTDAEEAEYSTLEIRTKDLDILLDITYFGE